MSETFYESVMDRLEVIKIAGIFNQQEMDLLNNFSRITKKNLIVDDHEYRAYRILHNKALGPGKGGIRFHPDVSEEEVKSLSLLMSLKNSLAGLPYGGAKGGIVINPKDKTPQELERISRAYVQEFHEVLGENIDIPAPDIYTNAQVMGWMLDEYEKIKGQHEPGMITGKPLALGGIAMRNDATAKGGFYMIQSLIKQLDWADKGLKVAIQGFGNAGSLIAGMLYDAGFKVVAVSDSKTAIMNPNGLDVTKLVSLKKQDLSLENDLDGSIIDNKKLLELEVDILVLAALENQITSNNAKQIKAKAIIELANGPISSEADSILFNKNILVVPDIAANAGGVTVSYFEWAQNKTGNILDKDYLENKLKESMRSIWERMYALYESRQKQSDLRTNAYILAIQRILEAEQARGNI